MKSILGKIGRIRVARPRFGIRGSLFAAFAVIAGMAILISVGAGAMLGQLGQMMTELNGRDIPKLTASLELATASESLASQGPMLLASSSADILKDRSQRMRATHQIAVEKLAAIARLGLPVRLLSIIPSTENMPSGHSTKPGDIIRISNGKTVEVNNTDAEGRLILADALAYAIELGAERVIDMATLTGAVVIALGSTYAAVIANDDELAAAVTAAGEETGELVWRLPLHPEFKEMMKGTVADLSNLAKKREAGTITASAFLEHFVDETPWAHIDIAGTAWDVNRAYTGKGGSGYGVRLLVQLVRDLAA